MSEPQVKVEFNCNEDQTDVQINISCPNPLSLRDMHSAFSHILEELAKQEMENMGVYEEEDEETGTTQ